MTREPSVSLATTNLRQIAIFVSNVLQATSVQLKACLLLVPLRNAQQATSAEVNPRLQHQLEYRRVISALSATTVIKDQLWPRSARQDLRAPTQEWILLQFRMLHKLITVNLDTTVLEKQLQRSPLLFLRVVTFAQQVMCALAPTQSKYQLHLAPTSPTLVSLEHSGRQLEVSLWLPTARTATLDTIASTMAPSLKSSAMKDGTVTLKRNQQLLRVNFALRDISALKV